MIEIYFSRVHDLVHTHYILSISTYSMRYIVLSRSTSNESPPQKTVRPLTLSRSTRLHHYSESDCLCSSGSSWHTDKPCIPNRQLLSFLPLHDPAKLSILNPFFWENPTLSQGKRGKKKEKKQNMNSLSNILPPPHPPRRHLPSPLPTEFLPPLPPLGRLQIIEHLRIHQPGADQITPHGPQIQRDPPHQAMRSRAVRPIQRPIGNRLLAHRARGQRDGRAGPGGQVAGREFREQERGGEADLAGPVDRLEADLAQAADRQLVARGEDDVVQQSGCGGVVSISITATIAAAGGAAVREQIRQVGFHGGRGEVAGEGLQTVRILGGGRVGLPERGEGGLDALRRGGGDDDVGAVLERGFGDGVADAGCTADDEDAVGVEFGGVFLSVGHRSGVYLKALYQMLW